MHVRMNTGCQNATLQIVALKACGCERVIIEHASGAVGAHLELARLMEHLRPCDTLVLSCLDRLTDLDWHGK